jgi:group I intron endonuclease
MDKTATGLGVDAGNAAVITRQSGVYEIRNTLNGKRYIGSAAVPRYRKQQHYSHLSKGTHCNRKLQYAWNKHGADVFVFRVILLCAKADLVFYEQRCFDRFRPEYNLTLTAGSLLGYKTSEETKAKLSAALKGKKRSPETRAKIGAGHKGKVISPEARAKMRAAKLGKVLSTTVRANMSASLRARGPEWRAKLSAARIGNKYSLGRKHPPEVLAKISAASLTMWATRKAKAAQ